MLYDERDVLKTWLMSDMLNFTRYFFKTNNHKKYAVGNHHRKIADLLNRVLRGEVKRAMINIGPRFGKTELVVKNFIAAGFALNPKSKFIHLSYSKDLAVDNSKAVKEIMELPEYQALFGCAPVGSGTQKWETTEGGGMYAVASAGQVTGFGAGLTRFENETATEDIIDDEDFPLLDVDSFGGAIIIDDPIKPDDALSSTIRNKVNNKFETTIRNRVNDRNTPIIIIMQRLHEDDLCGKLLKEEPDEWEVLSLPAITINDDREEEALWEAKLNLPELKEMQRKNPFVFSTQYMQNPKPLEGLMYDRDFMTYDIIPFSRKVIRKAYVDTADTGSDFLCAIIYDEMPEGNYIVDVLYTDKSMETTEPALATMLAKHKVQQCVIESNNGGRGFARAVEKLSRAMKNDLTRFKTFHQSKNKQVRIFTNANSVMNLTFMPSNWESLFPAFALTLKGYMKVGKNEHDDAPDALTGTYEERKNQISNSAETLKNLGL